MVIYQYIKYNPTDSEYYMPSSPPPPPHDSLLTRSSIHMSSPVLPWLSYFLENNRPIGGHRRRLVQLNFHSYMPNFSKNRVCWLAGWRIGIPLSWMRSTTGMRWLKSFWCVGFYVSLRCDTGHSPNAASMLGHRLRRWPNIETALGEFPVFLGLTQPLNLGHNWFNPHNVGLMLFKPWKPNGLFSNWNHHKYLIVQWILTKACFAVWTMFYDWFWYYGVSRAEISRVPLWHPWAKYFKGKNKMAARYFKVKMFFRTNEARNKCNTSFSCDFDWAIHFLYYFYDIRSSSRSKRQFHY